MAAIFTRVVRAPVTGIVLVAEMPGWSIGAGSILSRTITQMSSWTHDDPPQQ